MDRALFFEALHDRIAQFKDLRKLSPVEKAFGTTVAAGLTPAIPDVIAGALQAVNAATGQHLPIPQDLTMARELYLGTGAMVGLASAAANLEGYKQLASSVTDMTKAFAKVFIDIPSKTTERSQRNSQLAQASVELTNERGR